MTRRSFQGPISRTPDGQIALHLSAAEKELLRSLLAQVRILIRSEAQGLVDEGSISRRLFPTVYTEDEEREAGYQILARDELAESKLDAAQLVENTIDDGRLADEQADAWMRALNDIRLVLGTRLDVSEDDPALVDPDDPEAGMHAAYDYLGFLVDSLVTVLTQSLPPEDPDELDLT